MRSGTGIIQEVEKMNDVEKTKQALFSQKSAGDRFSDVLRGRFEDLRIRRVGGEYDKEIAELADYIAQYVRTVGSERAVLDVQTGINLLNGYNKSSPIEAKHELKEDKEFGEKTYMALRMC